MQDFRKLKVWKRAQELAMRVYRVLAGLSGVGDVRNHEPDEAAAAASIPANIAEGCGRRGRAELAQFLAIAMGSSAELQSHLILARDLEMICRRARPSIPAVAEVQMMLAALIARLIAASNAGAATGGFCHRVRF
jgi:four helix bundle protein